MLTGQQQYFIPLGNSYTLALNGMVDWGQSYGGKMCIRDSHRAYSMPRTGTTASMQVA